MRSLVASSKPVFRDEALHLVDKVNPSFTKAEKARATHGWPSGYHAAAVRLRLSHHPFGDDDDLELGSIESPP